MGHSGEHPRRYDARNNIDANRRHREAAEVAPQQARSSQSSFKALAPSLRQVRWPNKFKPGPIEKYDGSLNPEEFLQVYSTVIEATGEDKRVKANYLPTALSGLARSWLVNLLESTFWT